MTTTFSGGVCACTQATIKLSLPDLPVDAEARLEPSRYTIPAEEVNTGLGAEHVQEVELRLRLPESYHAAPSFALTVDVAGVTDNPMEEIVGLPTELVVDPPGGPADGATSEDQALEGSGTEGDEEDRMLVSGPAPVALLAALGLLAAARGRRD